MAEFPQITSLSRWSGVVSISNRSYYLWAGTTICVSCFTGFVVCSKVKVVQSNYHTLSYHPSCSIDFYALVLYLSDICLATIVMPFSGLTEAPDLWRHNKILPCHVACKYSLPLNGVSQTAENRRSETGTELHKIHIHIHLAAQINISKLPDILPTETRRLLNLPEYMLKMQYKPTYQNNIFNIGY